MENIDLNKIAELAYLEIQESEKDKLTQKLEKTIEYVGKIKELDFSDRLEKTSSAEPSLRLHPDEPSQTGIDTTAKF